MKKLLYLLPILLMLSCNNDNKCLEIEKQKQIERFNNLPNVDYVLINEHSLVLNDGKTETINNRVARDYPEYDIIAIDIIDVMTSPNNVSMFFYVTLQKKSSMKELKSIGPLPLYYRD